VTFDWTINVGHVLTAFSIVAAAIMTAIGMRYELKGMASQLDGHRERLDEIEAEQRKQTGILVDLARQDVRLALLPAASFLAALTRGDAAVDDGHQRVIIDDGVSGSGPALGTVSNPLVASQAPYGYAPIAGASQFGLSLATAQSLTVPPAARLARVCIRTAEAETTEDGTSPTAAPRGTAFAAGTCTPVSGASMAALKMISSAGANTASADVEYFQ
jgi:hypothetical protein